MKTIFVRIICVWFLCVEIRHVFPFTGERIYSGSLTPKELHICDGHDVTFRCQIWNNSLPEGALYFAVKIPPNDYYAIVNESEVVRDVKSAHFTLHAGVHDIESDVIRDEKSVKYMNVKCYYGQREDVVNESLIIGHPVLFPVHGMLVHVQNFRCIVEHYDVMVCTWQYGTEYDKDLKPEVTLLWKFSGTTQWQTCPELNSERTTCTWRRYRYIDADSHKNKVDIRITLKHKVCDDVTSNFTVNPTLLVKPNPVTDLRSTTINCTCIRLQWDSDSPWPYDYSIQINSVWNTTTVVKSGPQHGNGEKALRTELICNLEEDTTYKFVVTQKPRRGGFWSDHETTESTTFKDVPGASPALFIGGYYWDTKNCTNGGKMRKVCLLWQNITAIDQNGRMKGIDVTFISNGSNKLDKTFSEDTTYACAMLLCKSTYTVSVNARNEIGTSKMASTSLVQRWKPDVKQPTFTIEMARHPTNNGLSTIYVSYDPGLESITEAYIAWCVKSNGQCKSTGPVNWVRLSHNGTSSFDVSGAAEQYLYSVSTASHGISYGSYWEHCIYTKDVAPTVAPQNVMVNTGPGDNTLVVTWEKLGCKSGEPLIVAYRVKYCHESLGKCSTKEVQSNISRVALLGLEEDKEYTVQIQGIAAHNLDGPYSPVILGTPAHNSLVFGEIIGISCGALTLVIMAVVGCVFIVRLLREKAIKWKKKVGGVKIPEHIGLDLMNIVNKKQPNLVSA